VNRRAGRRKTFLQTHFLGAHIALARGAHVTVRHSGTLPIFVTEANGSQVEFVPGRSQKRKSLELTSPRPDDASRARMK
jgi:hypothetical protein